MKTMILLLAVLALAQIAQAGPSSLQTIPLKDINGKDTSLNAYSGKVVLLVNVASKCGYTKQYAALESLYEKYKDRGLVIVGVPSNDFGGQEPGTAEEIKTFCTSTYGVTFPLMEKVHVKGDEKCPLYAALTGKDSAYPGEVKWNFGKFLIGRDGKLLQRWDSAVTPDSPIVMHMIDSAVSSR